MLFLFPGNLKSETEISSDTTVTTLTSGGYNIKSSNTLTINNSGLITYSDLIRGTGSLVLKGSGDLNFSEEMTYTGSTTLQSNANLYILTNGGLPDTSAITMGTSYGDNTSITFDTSDTIGSLSGPAAGASALISLSYPDTNLTLSPSSGSTTYKGTISGMGGIIKAGAGTQTLSGQLSQGTLSVSAGTLIINNSSNNYSSTTISGGTLQSGDDSATDTGKITMTGGQLSSNGSTARTFSNNLDISGSVELGDTTNNGSVTISGTTTLLGNTILTNNSSVSLTATDVSNSYSLTKSGTGTLTLSGANTYDGGTTITAGTIEIDNNSSLGTGALTMTGGQLSSNGSTARSLSNTLNLNGNVEIGDASNTGAITLGATSITGASTLTTSSNVNLGAVSGNNAFTKTGSGTLTVNSISGSGATTINSGTLIALSTGSSPNVNGTFTRTGDTTINNGGTLIVRGKMLGAAVGGADPVWNSNLIINSGGRLRTYYDSVTESNTSIVMSTSNTITGSGEIYLEEIGSVFYRNNSDLTISADVIADSGFSQGGLEIMGSGTTTYDGTVTAIVRVQNGTLKAGPNMDATNGTIAISPNDPSLGNTSPNFDIAGRTLTVGTISVEANSGTGQPSIIDSDSTPGSLSFTTLNDDAADDTTSKTIISAILSGTGTIKPRGSSTYSTSITSASTGFTGGFSFDKANSNLEITGSGSVGSEIIDMYAGGLDSILTIDSGALSHSSPIIKIGPGDTLNVNGDEAFTLVNFIQIPGTEDATITLADNVTINVNIPTSYTETVHTGGDALTANDVFNQISLTGGANSRVKLVGSGTIDFHHFSDQSGSGGPGYSGDVEVAGATLTFGDSNEIHDSSDVIVSSGTLNFAARSDTVNSLTISGGTTTGTSSGTITVTNAMTVSGGTVSGKTFSAGSYALSGGTVSAVLAGSGNVTVSGDTTLNATNTFTGTVTVNSGATLRSDNNRGLGATSSGTTVASGGSLHLYSASGTKSYGEDITISGSGVSSSGAIQATGSNTITGDITLAANSTLVSNASATFTVGSAGSVNGSSGDYDLTLAGAGDFSFAGDINLGDGGLTISSTGTTSITGALTAGSYSVSGAATISNSITTSGAQSYLAGSSIGGTDNQAVTLTASSVTFGTSVAAIGNDIDLTITGNMTTTGEFESNVSATFGLLSVSGTSAIGADIHTNSTQTYTGATTLSTNSVMTTDNSNIIFGNTLNSASSTARRLAPNVGTGLVQFSGEVGATNALGLIDITGGLDLDANITGAAGLTVSLTSNLGANVTTSGNQTYTGRATLSSDVTLTGLNVNFGNQIIGGDNALTVTGNFDLDGAASGISSLSVSGSSDLGANVTTSGTQTYSGATTLSAATTLAGSSINLNTVTGGSNALTITGDLDLDGDIAGVTSLSVSGATNIGGDVATINNQTYTGLTTVSASKTLSGAAITASVVNLGSNDLGISNTAASSITGIISGTNGSLTKLGSGTLTLSNVNTYTGDTTIDAGTLKVTGTLSDSTDVIVASGANYNVDENDTVKSVTGLGSAIVATSKTLILSNSDNGSTSTVFSGSGNLTKSGTGTLTFLGESTISGDVTVSNGTLYAGNASSSTDTIFNTDVTVNGSNAVLGGGGIIAGNVTVTNGTIAPGNSIGTLYVSGNLDLTANSTTNIEFNNDKADKIVIGIGSYTTSLGGTISLYPEDDTYETKSHIIIDASNGGTFTGNFSTETINNESNLNGASWDIVYDTTAKTVSLDLTAAAAASCNINCTTTISGFKDVAKIFDDTTDTSGKFKEIKDVLGSATVNSVNTELNKLEGTVLASTYTQASNNHGFFNRALSSVTTTATTSLVSNFTSSGNDLTLASLQDRGLYGDKSSYNEYYDFTDNTVLGFVKNNKNKTFFENFNSEDKSTFLRTYGTTTSRKDIGASYTGYKSNTTGILFGEQFKNSDEEFNGYSIGLTHTGTDYNKNYGDADVYSLHASLFKQLDQKDQAFNLLGSAFLSRTDSTRNVAIFGTTVDDKYKSDFYDLGLNLEAQHVKKFDVNGYKISPSFKTNYTYVFKGDTKESGGDLALKVENNNLFTVKPEIGLSIGKNFSKDSNKVNQFDIAAFASRDYFIEGKENTARFASGTGTSFNQELPRDYEDYYSLGLGYNFLNKETDTSLMTNIFLIENSKKDTNSNIFSITFRKLFGEFGKGRIPPVIATKPNNEEDIIKITLPKNKKDQNNKDKAEEILEELEKNIEIVLKEDPTKAEVAQVYKSINDNLIAKRKLTINDVYNNLSANCYAVENNLVELVNYYSKIQLYKILDKCSRLSEPKVHLIAERLHQIQLDETTALQELYYGYLRFLKYVPFVTFIAFIIFIYEFVRRYIVNHFKRKNFI